jgi:hypothetical protein
MMHNIKYQKQEAENAGGSQTCIGNSGEPYHSKCLIHYEKDWQDFTVMYDLSRAWMKS